MRLCSLQAAQSGLQAVTNQLVVRSVLPADCKGVLQASGHKDQVQLPLGEGPRVQPSPVSVCSPVCSAVLLSLKLAQHSGSDGIYCCVGGSRGGAGVGCGQGAGGGGGVRMGQ